MHRKLVTTTDVVQFALVERPGHYANIVIVCCISGARCAAGAVPLMRAGFCIFGALPVGLELVVETTYPVGQGTSATFLWLTMYAASHELLLLC